MAKRKRRKSTSKKTQVSFLDALLWGGKSSKRGRKSAKEKKHEELWKLEVKEQVNREIWGIISLSIAVLIFLSINGNLGIIGDGINTIIKPIFGYGIYIIPAVLIIISISLFLSKTIKVNLAKSTGLGLFIISILSILHLSIPEPDILTYAKAGSHGGYIGFITNFLLRSVAKVGNLGSSVIFITVFLVSLLLTFDVSLNEIINKLLNKETEKPAKKRKQTEDSDEEELEVFKRIVKERGKPEINIIKPEDHKPKRNVEHTPAPMQSTVTDRIEEVQSVKIDVEKSEESTLENRISEWEFPTLDLLSDQRGKIHAKDSSLIKNAEKIKNKLSQFGIEVQMKDVHVGPTVIQYTLKPSEGVKLSKITTLKNDLALTLAAPSIRIEAPIPGKALVGIEVPTENRTQVRLRELLESTDFESASAENKLTLPLGRDVSGSPIVTTLNDMPHLLIAGATGSGKSVGINTFLISLLYQNSPADLKMILIDPKQVELRDYNGIPHLLTEVVTDPEKAANALKWAVAEMTKRYNTLSLAGCRSIDEYNAEEGREKKMPKILILIDELADLMMANGKEVEASICRIAQMARAVGIHLVVATQRPSVDVITGLIKANIPTRISFAVSSSIDSRTILDTIGAEDLLGRGDMLYLPKDFAKPMRIQGIYIDPAEIKKVTNKLKLTLEPDYKDEITVPQRNSNSSGDGSDASEEDELYPDAIDVIAQYQKASASLLQRKLKIGYARAARLLDLLEENGIVGPVNGAKPREIFLSQSDSE